MYKNQLQELAQRSCFNLPSYTCIREGPDHAPRFRASVNFNGEIFESPSYCTTLRQAEHAAAEVALNTLSTRVPSRLLAARVLDEIGVYKNLLQESVHRAGLTLPVYTTERSGPGHLPVFISIVELAGMSFSGETARTKKQAEKNAAMAAWSALKQLSNMGSTSQTNKETETSEEQEQVVVARVLSNFRPKGESKNLRQRDQNQARGRMVSSYRDNYSGSSSKPSLQQQRRSLGLFPDFSSICSTQVQNQQKGSFITLLTPSCSKILPPTSSIDNSSHSLCSSTQLGMKDVPPPLEEHKKDEDEWLNGRADMKEKNSYGANSNSVFRAKPAYHRTFSSSPMPDHTQSIHMKRTTPCGGIAPPSTVTRPRILNCGGFHIAPAVHIRSVIPVCAAPPPPSNSTIAAPQKKQDLSSVSYLKQREQEEFPALEEASLKLNKLHL